MIYAIGEPRDCVIDGMVRAEGKMAQKKRARHSRVRQPEILPALHADTVDERVRRLSRGALRDLKVT